MRSTRRCVSSMADRPVIDVDTPPGGWGLPWPNVAEIEAVLPHDNWTLVGGLMAQLHGIHRGIDTVRPTNDVDIVLHVETTRGVANRAARALESIGYELAPTFDADESMVTRLCAESANLVHWLVDDWDISLSLVDDFKYPKHSEYRMHAPPGRNGATLIAELEERVEATDNIELLTNAPVTKLVADDGVVGVVAGDRRDEAIEADSVILATDGFGGNKRMVTEWCDELDEALYFGADGNTGDGIRWGAELGGELACMDAYQGHATVAYQTGALSTYAVVMNGGVVVNAAGERFGDESAGYSAFAVDVLRQPGSVAYEIFDRRIFERLAGEFDDFDEAVSLGAYHEADSVDALAEQLGCDRATTAATIERYNAAVAADERDETGRTDGMHTLSSPFYGAEVTGALFHTQGGLVVDEHGRVLREDDSAVPGLYAGGGCAVGISGHGPGGYLSGNGLTTALGLGRLAGRHARRSLTSD